MKRFFSNRRNTLLLDLAALLLLWFFAADQLNEAFLPDPLTVVQTFGAELQGDLIEHTLVSARRVLVSVFLGAITAGPLAIFAAQSAVLDRFVSPLIYFLYPAPKIVFLPIIIYIFGLGDPSIVFLIALIIFFQVYVIVRDAASGIPAETLDSVESLGAGMWQKLRFVYLPTSIPAILTALKISIGTAVAVLFIAESIGNNVGLGYYIVVEQWNRFAYTKVYAGILAMSLLGLSLFVVLNLIEQRLTRWQRT
jgi:ABC-type nitrate/sulfonate/bicarbonate transport system permease component